jgi:hypothetical protein
MVTNDTLLSDIDDLVDKFYRKREVEEKKADIKIESKTQPAERSAEIVVYFRNFNHHYRAQIVPISKLATKPGVVRGKIPENVGDGIEPVFLTKHAKADVAKCITMYDASPDDYITPAAMDTREGGELNQGVAYCTSCIVTSRNNYHAFLKGREVKEEPKPERSEVTIEISNEPVIDDQKQKKIDDLVECRCADCQNSVVIKVVNSFKCIAGVFNKYKPASEINNIIWCKKTSFQKRT